MYIKAFCKRYVYSLFWVASMIIIPMQSIANCPEFVASACNDAYSNVEAKMEKVNEMCRNDGGTVEVLKDRSKIWPPFCSRSVDFKCVYSDGTESEVFERFKVVNYKKHNGRDLSSEEVDACREEM